jgi:hypothetical protein
MRGGMNQRTGAGPIEVEYDENLLDHVIYLLRQSAWEDTEMIEVESKTTKGAGNASEDG